LEEIKGWVKQDTMIKFFRQFRYKSMEKNKSSKYFKYAIGEIVLVVIGILIALQINNWNQSEKERVAEIKYLNNIHRDLKEQLNYIKIQKSYEMRFTEAANPVLSYYNENSKFACDSVFFTNITILNSRNTFITSDPTYTDLISSGNITLIKNDTLKDKIITYYQELELIEKIIQNNNTLIIDQQYADIMQMVGYYYYNSDKGYLGIEGFEKMNSSILETKAYNSQLAEISKTLLSVPANQLSLINVINHRHIISVGHYKRLTRLEKETTNLIHALTRIIND
jgi:hypothetical protein